MNDQRDTGRRVTDTPGNFLSSLVAADDRRTDSITIGGIFSIVCATAIFGYDVMINGHEAGAFSFGGGIAAIITAMAGGKTIRDKVMNGSAKAKAEPDVA